MAGLGGHQKLREVATGCARAIGDVAEGTGGEWAPRVAPLQCLVSWSLQIYVDNRIKVLLQFVPMSRGRESPC